MALVRLPVDRDGLHLIPLYDEVPVVVASPGPLVAAADEVTLADLVDEQLVLRTVRGWRPDVPQLDWPPMTEREAVETVAAGTGIGDPADVGGAALPPQGRGAPARQRPRPDDRRPGLARRRDDERTQRFVGVVRGRTARSRRLSRRLGWRVVTLLSPGTPAELAASRAAAFRTAYGAEPGRRRPGPGPGQPDRRAHRLQRRHLPAGRAPPRDVRRRARRAPTTWCGCAARRPTTSGRDDGHRAGRGDGWASYVAGVAWALREAGVEVPGLDVCVDSTRAAGRRAVVVGGPGVLGRGGDRRTWPGSPTTSRERRPGGRVHARRDRGRGRTHRRHGPDGRVARASPAPRCSSTSSTTRPCAGAARPRPTRGWRAGRSTPGSRTRWSTAGTPAAAPTASGPAAQLGVPSLREATLDRRRGPRRRPDPAAGPARRHRDRPRRRRRRRARAGGLAGGGRAVRRLARLDARRLRDLLPRARRRRRGGPRGRRASAPG